MCGERPSSCRCTTIEEDVEEEVDDEVVDDDDDDNDNTGGYGLGGICRAAQVKQFPLRRSKGKDGIPNCSAIPFRSNAAKIVSPL